MDVGRSSCRNGLACVSVSSSSGWPLGGELPSGCRQLLAESTAGVAVWSRPDGVDPQRLALVLLS
jgi:hypothetical protein